MTGRSRQHLKYLISIRLAAIFLALFLIPSTLLGSSDISAIVEKKGPKAKEVLAKPTITRKSELPNLPISLKQYEFFVDHPRLSMILARLSDPTLDPYKVTLNHDGSIHVDEPGGLSGDVEVLNSSHGSRVYLITGYYDLFKIRFHGRVLMVSEYSEKRAAEHVSTDARATSYIKIDSAVAGALTKLVNFVFPKKVDGRIGRFISAVRIAALAVHGDPVGTYNKLSVSKDVDPAELKEFTEIFALKTGPHSQ